MQIITKPTVKVGSFQQFIEDPDTPLPPDGDSPVRIGAHAAKGCYDSYGADGRPCEENQRGIIGHEHGSVLEHIVFGVRISGITRALSLEMNRHRHFAISQRSTRYTREEDAAIVLEPYLADIYERRQADAKSVSIDEARLIVDHVSTAQDALRAYEFEVDLLMKMNPKGLDGFDLRKWARGKARNILPHSLETRVTYTGNLRAWRHFLEMRSSRHAEEEIRRLSNYVFEALEPMAPLYFEDYRGDLVDGWYEYNTPHRKI